MTKFIREDNRYISPFKKYSGYIQFPDPIHVSHYKAWVDCIDEDIDTKDKFDNVRSMKEWRASISILEKWDLENISALPGNPDVFPLEVFQWIRLAGSDYVSEKLDPKNWHEPPETTPKKK